MATIITLTEFILETRVNFKVSADAPVEQEGEAHNTRSRNFWFNYQAQEFWYRG